MGLQEDKRHLLADGAAILAESVRMMKSRFHMDLVAIVHPTVKHSRPILEKVCPLIPLWVSVGGGARAQSSACEWPCVRCD